MIHLILNARISTHVSEDTVSEFEEVILSDHRVQPSNGEQGVARLLGALTWKLLEAIPGSFY